MLVLFYNCISKAGNQHINKLNIKAIKKDKKRMQTDIFIVNFNAINTLMLSFCNWLLTWYWPYKDCG